ncbi:MAG: hypothetical protein EBR62_08825, partial [Verrucomicrobia bacterium]|nr:hypothetical protein [Verrucomicrobiota bacterium]
MRPLLAWLSCWLLCAGLQALEPCRIEVVEQKTPNTLTAVENGDLQTAFSRRGGHDEELFFP